MDKAEYRDRVLIEQVKEVGAQNRRASVVQGEAGRQAASTGWRPLYTTGMGVDFLPRAKGHL